MSAWAREGAAWKAVTALVGVALAAATWGRWTTTALTRDVLLWAAQDQRPARDAHVVLVTVGDDDLIRYRSREPQFLDRRAYARALDRLVAHGVSTIVFDVLFDRPTPGDEDSDQELAGAVARARRVILAQGFVRSQRGGRLELVHSLPGLERAALAVGYVNVAPDSDGVIRRVKLVVRHEGRLMRHVALEAVARHAHARRIEPVEQGILIEFADRPTPTIVPSNPDGSSIMALSTLPPVARVSIHELLEPGPKEELHRELFKNKVVVIGSVSPILKDQHPYLRHWVTGERVLEDGPWFIAGIVDGVLEGSFLSDSTPRLGRLPLLIFATLVAVHWIAPLGAGIVLVVALMVLGWVATAALYMRGILFDGVAWTLGVLAVGVTQAFGRALTERLRLAGLNRELSRKMEGVRNELEAATMPGRVHVQAEGGVPSYLERSFIARFLPARFRELAFIGQGGTAVVYRALDTGRGHPVALKVLSPLLQDSRVAVRRFMGEARLMKKLEHPGLVRVFEVGREVLPYFTMELVEGRSLSELVASGGSMPVGRALAIGRAVAEVLGYIHGRGIVHRDIKPSNVMVLDAGTVKLLDFGLARDEDVTVLTRSGDVLGTLRYMAPEQLNSAAVAASSDVYGLGVLLVELILGQVPARQGFVHVFPRAGLTLVPTPPPAIDLLERCMSEDPARRPPDGAALERELARLEEGAPAVKG